MKTIALTLIGLLVSISFNAQTVELPETIVTLNYKYLESRAKNDAAKRVKELQAEVLKYNYKTEISELYGDEGDTFDVSFTVPRGKIIAAYDKNGKIIKTTEKYNNVRLPMEVVQAISKRYPDWSIIEDIYLVKYHCDSDDLKHRYKVTIKKNNDIMTLKTNEKGMFL
jgi:hypothetical protein